MEARHASQKRLLKAKMSVCVSSCLQNARQTLRRGLVAKGCSRHLSTQARPWSNSSCGLYGSIRKPCLSTGAQSRIGAKPLHTRLMYQCQGQDADRSDSFAKPRRAPLTVKFREIVKYEHDRVLGCTHDENMRSFLLAAGLRCQQTPRPRTGY